MSNGLMKGIMLGIGVGIGIVAAREAKKAYDRHRLKQKIKGLWSNIKNAWSEASEATT